MHWFESHLTNVVAHNWHVCNNYLHACLIPLYADVSNSVTNPRAPWKPPPRRPPQRRRGIPANMPPPLRRAWPPYPSTTSAAPHRPTTTTSGWTSSRYVAPPHTPPPPSVMGVSPRRLAAAIGKSRRDVTSSSTMAASEGGRDGDAGVRGDSCRPSARRNAAPGCCWSALDKSWEFSFSEKKSASEIVAYDSAFLFWIQLLLPSLSFFDTTAVAS